MTRCDTPPPPQQRRLVPAPMSRRLGPLLASLSPLLLLLLLLLLQQARPADAHGCMTSPAQRGCLTGRQPNDLHPFVFKSYYNYPDSVPDLRAHFPAGDKSLVPGSALRSQIAFAKQWGPFEPTSRTFRWRAGVCGDHRKRNAPDPPQDHLRGGKFYYGAQIVETWTEGSTVSFANSIIAHHNGYVEYHLCDVRRCKGDISEDCFHKKACFKLMRAFDPECQSGRSQRCGPIDRRNPGRWYLPCRRTNLLRRDGNTFNYYGFKNSMRYRLPRGFTCEHCVLHWYWVAANTCNPPGVLDYFNGPDRPRSWGRCPGQGGARGGAARQQGPCGGRRFPEEYYTCADVRIVPRGEAIQPRVSKRVFSHIELVKRGKGNKPVNVRAMRDGSFHRFRFRSTDKIDFRAVVIRRPVRKGVTFYSQAWSRRGKRMNLTFQRTDRRRPFYMSGEREVKGGTELRYWKRAFRFQRFDIIARAEGQQIRVSLQISVS